MDDECIQDLLTWRHPYVTNADELQYRDEEKMEMLRLPSRECELCQLHWPLCTVFSTGLLS